MPVYERKKMCDDCPFRAKSLQGWLGPYTVDDFEKIIHSETGMICHTAIDDMKVKGYEDDEIEEYGQHCIGMFRYRNNVCKTSRDSVIEAYQDSLKKVKDEPVIGAFEFRKHHEDK